MCGDDVRGIFLKAPIIYIFLAILVGCAKNSEPKSDSNTDVKFRVENNLLGGRSGSETLPGNKILRINNVSFPLELAEIVNIVQVTCDKTADLKEFKHVTENDTHYHFYWCAGYYNRPDGTPFPVSHCSGRIEKNKDIENAYTVDCSSVMIEPFD